MKTKKKKAATPSGFTRGEKVSAKSRRHARKTGGESVPQDIDEGNAGAYGRPRKPGEENPTA